jgi:hypothetical protein
VIAAGVVGWILTDRPVFAVFLVLGVLTAAGAWWTGRSAGPASKEGPR